MIPSPSTDPKTGVFWGKVETLSLDHIMDGVCLTGLIIAPVYLLYKFGMFCIY